MTGWWLPDALEAQKGENEDLEDLGYKLGSKGWREMWASQLGPVNRN